MDRVKYDMYMGSIWILYLLIVVIWCPVHLQECRHINAIALFNIALHQIDHVHR